MRYVFVLVLSLFAVMAMAAPMDLPGKGIEEGSKDIEEGISKLGLEGESSSSRKPESAAERLRGVLRKAIAKTRPKQQIQDVVLATQRNQPESNSLVRQPHLDQSQWDELLKDINLPGSSPPPK